MKMSDIWKRPSCVDIFESADIQAGILSNNLLVKVNPAFLQHTVVQRV